MVYKLYCFLKIYNVQISCLYIHSLGSYSCRNGILNAINSKSVRIRIKERVRWAATNMTIYGPIGDDTSLQLKSDLSRYSFEYAIIYASNTTKIELLGSGNYRHKGLILYAYHSNSIYIDCDGDNQPCIAMKIYLHSTSLNIQYPMDRLYMQCSYEFDCTNSELIVSYDNSSTWTCTFIYNRILERWFCGNYNILSSTKDPTPSPTNKPTLTTIIPTLSPTIPTLTPITPIDTDSPTVSPTFINTNINTESPNHIFSFALTRQNLPWIITGLLIIAICITIFPCVGS